MTSLSPEQLAAVNAGAGAYCVLASAGAGKTRVLVERYKRLIAAGERPEDILCLTFTRKAATEMRDRAGAPPGLLRPHGFRTFHSLAYGFDIAEKTGIADMYEDGPDGDPPLFDSLLSGMVSQLKHHPGVASRWQVKWVMVDEANDLTMEQVELLQLLSVRHGNVWICGDVNQAIFGFAGSTPEPMVHFDRYFLDGKTLTMGTNYRSTKSIVEFCRRLAPIQTELLDRLNTSNEQGEAPTFHEYNNSVAEAYGVVREIFDTRTPLEEWMILARTNRQLETLKQWRIPAMTIHKSKGLAWPNVWVIGCQDGYLPLTGADENEEQRLLFVAASRAEKTLHLSSYGTISRFLQTSIAGGLLKQ